jgi:hypothetical protein
MSLYNAIITAHGKQLKIGQPHHLEQVQDLVNRIMSAKDIRIIWIDGINLSSEDTIALAITIIS